ncbi:MAG: transketolase [Oligoflexia bacterium]|nr:transketolase [Oligoflexia bacterium]
MSDQKLELEIKKMILESFHHGGRGHVPSAFSITKILISLYCHYLNLDKNNYGSDDRDRFILSKGHGCLALYAMLAHKEIFSKEELLKFCHFNSLLGGHPNAEKIPGVEYSSGSLGHGLSFSVGIAKALKIKKKKNKVVCLVGDGEINEGSVWEALLSANLHQLDNLTILVDYNKVQSFGNVKDVMPLEPLEDKFKSFGMAVSHVEDLKISNINNELQKTSSAPRVIICHTLKGEGIDEMEKDFSWHHKGKISEEKYQELVGKLEATYA